MLNNFIQWLRPSFEGTNQTASARRLTAFFIALIYGFGRWYYIMHVTDAYYLLMGTVVDALFVLILFSIITLQGITELVQSYRNQKPEEGK